MHRFEARGLRRRTPGLGLLALRDTGSWLPGAASSLLRALLHHARDGWATPELAAA